MDARKTWAILATLALLGCSQQPVALLATQLPAEPIAIPKASAGLAPAVEVSPPQAEQDGTATLKLTIRWPKAKGYGVATLPLSAQSLHFAVKQGEKVLDSKLIYRQPGVETASATFHLKAATDVTLVIRAYGEASPDLKVAQAIAEGSSQPFSLVPSKFTNVSVVLAPSFPPSIESVRSPYQGEAETAGSYYASEGDEIVLTGHNFQMGDPPVVFFNRTNTAESPPVPATRVSSTELRVKVPAQAASGKLYVMVDGIGLLTPATLWVPTVSIDAPKQPYDTLPADNRMVPDEEGYTGTEVPKPIPGSTITLTAKLGWALPPDATLADFGTPPLVTPTWNRTSEWAGFYTVTGRYTLLFKPRPLADGTVFFATNMTAQVGSVKSNTLNLIIVDVCQAYACP